MDFTGFTCNKTEIFNCILHIHLYTITALMTSCVYNFTVISPFSEQWLWENQNQLFSWKYFNFDILGCEAINTYRFRSYRRRYVCAREHGDDKADLWALLSVLLIDGNGSCGTLSFKYISREIWMDRWLSSFSHSKFPCSMWGHLKWLIHTTNWHSYDWTIKIGNSFSHMYRFL